MINAFSEKSLVFRRRYAVLWPAMTAARFHVGDDTRDMESVSF
jgi:hypothetical protein